MENVSIKRLKLFTFFVFYTVDGKKALITYELHKKNILYDGIVCLKYCSAWEILERHRICESWDGNFFAAFSTQTNQ